MPKKIEISHRTIIFTILFLILVGFLYLIRDILLMIFVALLVTAILNPIVTRLSEYKIPRAISTLVLYILGITLIVLTFAGISSPVIEQTSTLVAPVPDFIKKFRALNEFSGVLINEIFNAIGTLPSRFARVLVSAISNVANVIFVLVLTFYMVASRDKLENSIQAYFGTTRQKQIMGIIEVLENKLGGWMRGQLMLMILVGLLSYIGLNILGVPHAIALSFWAGIMEIIPYFGPFIAAVPALIIAFGVSPVMFIATLALYFLVQQIENYLFVPKVMQKSAGVNPITTLLALAIGFKLAGIGGILLSVPVVIVLQVLAKEYFVKK